MYRLLDIFFLVFHSGIIVFNVLGWIPKATQRLNLITLILTGLSWFVLGIFYGIGYCPFTDWHWQVLRKLGKSGLPNSYIKYLLDRITGVDVNATFIDYMTAILFFVALACSVFVNIKRKK